MPETRESMSITVILPLKRPAQTRPIWLMIPWSARIWPAR
jgi:hypothetical protein